MLVRTRKRDGRAYQVLEIRNPAGGGRLTIPDPDLLEHLSPSVVGNYQRRLGLKTPFASKPSPTPPDTPTAEES